MSGNSLQDALNISGEHAFGTMATSIRSDLNSPLKRFRSVRRPTGAVGVASIHEIDVKGDDGGIEMRQACDKLDALLKARQHYKALDKGDAETTERLPSSTQLQVRDGIVYFTGETTEITTWEQYYDDIMSVLNANDSPQCCAVCRYRLQILEEKFHMHGILNSEIEENTDRCRRGGGVFASSTKVDNSVQLSTSMNALYLLEFIQRTVQLYGEEVVQYTGDDMRPQTLRELFNALEIEDSSSLTVEGLGLHPPTESQFYRFDAFDPELNRAGKPSSDLIRVFLRRDTASGGTFLADAVRPLMEQREAKTRGVTATELSVEITGLVEDEWLQLARWLHYNRLGDFQTNMWVIRFPRNETIRSTKCFEFHQKHFENLFLPLFMATLAPEDPKHVELAKLLGRVSAISIQSDENVREASFVRKRRPPGEVPWSENVCDFYFNYYVWANLTSLNALRRRKGMNTFQLRSVAGERATQLDSLVYGMLVCDSISVGILLQEHPVLQFLYGALGVGISMSPLSNNGIHMPYFENPFPTFFRRSLNVTLATDNPLHYHHCPDALLEEYGTACKLYKLSGVDMAELARNSVLISGFPVRTKRKWLGDRFQSGPQGNRPDLSSVPTTRLEFRQRVWRSELAVIEAALQRRRISHHEEEEAALMRSPVTQRVTSKAYPLLPQAEDELVRFPRVMIFGPQDRDAEDTYCAQQLHRAMKIRSEYVWTHGHAWERRAYRLEHAFKRTESFNENPYTYSTVEGVVTLHEKNKVPRLPEHIHTYDDFRTQLIELKAITENVHVREFCNRRLLLLEHKFKLHVAVNHSNEAGSTEEKASQNRDFYQATKVDTNVRMESGMTARQLLNFIVGKAQHNGDDIVCQRKGREPQTLRQLLEELSINPQRLTVDDLNVQVDTTLSQTAFQYTPEGRDELLTLILKTDNTMNGRYFAELTKLTFEQFKQDKFTFAENRLPIYGASFEEWQMLSAWFDTHGMASFHNRWMIQIPRIYGYLRSKGRVETFAEYLNHVFCPLWEVSLHPTKDPRLFHFLNHISGFDCVEDEKKPDVPISTLKTIPEDWVSPEDPPYNYYLYHIWSNITTLNDFRAQRGFSTFSFRPSCGENGSVDHLVGGFMLCNAISYGINLRNDPAMQYLFYLAQIGIAVSPLSNNTNVLDYLDNPFPSFFRRGLNVSLSTDGPLRFHHTQEPLIEEYSIASKVWKLSPNDLCEVARNSVKQSGFDHDFMTEHLGDRYFLSSSISNTASKTHLSDIRVAYRWEAYHSEVSLLDHVSGLKFQRALLLQSEEKELVGQHIVQSEAARDGIIVAEQNSVDVQKLKAQREQLQHMLDELTGRAEEFRRQNKLLSSHLAEAVQIDSELRRTSLQLQNEEIDFQTATAAFPPDKGESSISIDVPPPKFEGPTVLTRYQFPQSMSCTAFPSSTSPIEPPSELAFPEAEPSVVPSKAPEEKGRGESAKREGIKLPVSPAAKKIGSVRQKREVLVKLDVDDGLAKTTDSDSHPMLHPKSSELSLFSPSAPEKIQPAGPPEHPFSDDHEPERPPEKAKTKNFSMDALVARSESLWGVDGSGPDQTDELGFSTKEPRRSSVPSSASQTLFREANVELEELTSRLRRGQAPPLVPSSSVPHLPRVYPGTLDQSAGSALNASHGSTPSRKTALRTLLQLEDRTFASLITASGQSPQTAPRAPPRRIQ